MTSNHLCCVTWNKNLTSRTVCLLMTSHLRHLLTILRRKLRTFLTAATFPLLLSTQTISIVTSQMKYFLCSISVMTIRFSRNSRRKVEILSKKKFHKNMLICYYLFSPNRHIEIWRHCDVTNWPFCFCVGNIYTSLGDCAIIIPICKYVILYFYYKKIIYSKKGALFINYAAVRIASVAINSHG